MKPDQALLFVKSQSVYVNNNEDLPLSPQTTGSHGQDPVQFAYQA